MNIIVKRQLSILSLALGGAMAVAMPAVVHAQSYASESRALAISSLEVQQLQRLRPGNVLSFSLTSSPRAKVSLQIAGATQGVQLRETSPGTYEGDYTIRKRDKLTAASLVTARVLKDGQAVSATMSQSLVLGAPDPTPQAVAQISGFNISAPDGMSPGDELGFLINGTPGAKVRVAVQGVSNPIPLAEVSRGRYEGTYVIRRQDRLGGELAAETFLVNGQRETSQRYQGKLSNARDEQGRTVAQRNDGRNDGRDTRPQAIASCATCGAVESVNVIEVNSDQPNVLGTIAGGLLGGVVGHQVGGGSGKDIATVVGAVGGAYAGNRVQNNMGKSRVFRVAVRMDGGTIQSFDYAEDPVVQVGTRVKVDQGLLLRL